MVRRGRGLLRGRHDDRPRRRPDQPEHRHRPGSRHLHPLGHPDRDRSRSPPRRDRPRGDRRLGLRRLQPDRRRRRYNFNLPPGSYKLYIEPNKAGYTDQWYDGAGASFAAGTTIVLAADQTSRNIVIAPAAATYTLSGTLTGTGADPLPDAIVHVVTDAWVYVGSSPIVAGRYNFNLPPGSYKLYIEPNKAGYTDQWYDGAGASFAAGTTIVLAADQTSRNIVIARGSRHLHPLGHLTGTGADPLPDAIVHVVTDAGVYVGSSPIVAGRYNFNLPPGSYKLYIEPNKAGYTDQWYDGAGASFAAGTTIVLAADQTSRNIVIARQPPPTPSRAP